MRVAKVTILLDEKWGSHNSDADIRDFLTTYIDSRIGFRGTVKKVKVVEAKDRQKRIS